MVVNGKKNAHHFNVILAIAVWKFSVTVIEGFFFYPFMNRTVEMCQRHLSKRTVEKS